ncbi:glycosyltransferase family 2 protein [Rhodococcus rhodnii]|uniref:Glycosyltransferase 2-like domain-containing protein n=1 Tax=Rhodococcus rhodnii LMG 5362 TaxID=1273125 RepID=R7WJZ4_9NOCA|nr:glycosyltransferase [Rhodococcus rhodnii]EOM75627.1 hypothetical protein Rrhod_3087 [Rhodococcus rhodnii LMG 5362]
MSTVSVVVPVHRCEPYVEAALASVLAQTHPVHEIVLVDDRGDDDSMRTATAFLSARGAPFTAVTHATNLGPGTARNTGLAASTGELVWFLDADDTADPHFVATLAAALRDSGADLAACRTQRLDGDGAVLGIDEPTYPAAITTGPEFARLLLRGGAKAYPCTKLFRRSALGERPWDEGRHYEDIAATFRIALASGLVALVDDPLYSYLLRSGSITTTLSERTLDLFAVGADVADAVAAAGLAGEWADDLRGFVYREVLTSIAHVAMRADHAATAPRDLYRTAITRVRDRIDWAELPALARTGHVREAVFGALVSVAPSAYSAVLRFR